MGVYIKDMEIPTRCFNCGMCEVDDTQILCCISHGSYVEYRELDEQIAIQDRPTWCPLVEVPPHGDLIDRDETMNEIFEARQCYDAVDFAGVVNAMPTIIESEEGKDNAD